MKTASLVGLILIVLGIVSFAYQGITYTTHKKVLDLGPLQATTEQHKTNPPTMGGSGMVLCCSVVACSGRDS
jgi:UDP-N-acetylmuramyl pentapeptide phosphotransferase/UDP-N-acetylglucosamine-1-phosphate transferase